MKDMWEFNHQASLIKNWTKVDMLIVKEYQQDVNQFSTNGGVRRNWLHDLLQNSTTEELCSKIYETYLIM